MYPLLDVTQSCLFCKKAKKWSSVIMLVNSKTKAIMVAVTVCPEDRKKHTIQDIYETMVKQSYEELKKVVEKEKVKQK